MDTEISLYRRWRPQNFEEVAGQVHVVKTLKNMVESGKINHAYLFTGPRGTGKTSVARILARAINCLNPLHGNPCGKCLPCNNLLNGFSLDILEIDAASNRGIDEIKDLRSKVSFTPALLKYKVYIIDEVHMLTPEAFNALLKTLEEPPNFVVFVLATTEPHKVPPTIASRCLRFDFRNLSEEDMINLLKKVCDHEGFSIEEKSLSILIEASQGSLRDALTYLEQVESFAGKEMKDEDVYIVLGIPSPAWVRDYLLDLLLKRRENGINRVEELVGLGRDFRQSIRQVIIQLRNLIIVRMGEGSKKIFVDEELLTNTSAVPIEDLISALDRLISQENELRFSLDPRLTLELFTLKEASPVSIKLPAKEGMVPPKYEEILTETKTISVSAVSETTFSLDNFIKFIKETKKHFIFGSMISLATEYSFINNDLTLYYRVKEKAQLEFLNKEKANLEKMLSEFVKTPSTISLKYMPEKNSDFDLRQDPIVKKALELFEGSSLIVRKVDEDEK